jgi:hypothetical protein
MTIFTLCIWFPHIAIDFVLVLDMLNGRIGNQPIPECIGPNGQGHIIINLKRHTEKLCAKCLSNTNG